MLSADDAFQPDFVATHLVAAAVDLDGAAGLLAVAHRQFHDGTASRDPLMAPPIMVRFWAASAAPAATATDAARASATRRIFDGLMAFLPFLQTGL